MQVAKVLSITLGIYVAIVVAFESRLGYFQPAIRNSVTIITTDDNGETSERVLSRFQSGGRLYVAANHWPRAWYRRALKNPEVMIVDDTGKTPHLAVPVVGDEHAAVEEDHPLPFRFRVLAGFPPRYFLRLDPR